MQSIGQMSVKYRWSSIGEVSVNRQVYRTIGVSVDTSVDTRPIHRPVLEYRAILGRVTTDGSTDVSVSHKLYDPVSFRLMEIDWK